MSAVYDNWERLVSATIRREELRLSALRTPSDVSSASLSSSSSFNFASSSTKVSSFNNSSRLPAVGKSFTYDQILLATDYFSKSNFIKHGRSGDLFHGVLEGGLQVVVKKVDLSVGSYLVNELEILGKVSHARFVPFLGHCFENGNNTFLVYKYMLNKDLSSCLSNRGIAPDGIKVDCQKSTSLSWATRLKIATGAAQGLCYLHHECLPPLVHRNFEARSILIDESFEARIGRLTEVSTEKKEKNQNRISRLLRLSKASEGGDAGSLNATYAYDVYCFGKVLLELVTGYPGFGDHNDLSINAGMEDILPYISTYDKELFVNIVDPSLEVDEDQLIELWAVAIIAKACLNPKPSKRPVMPRILEALEDPKSVMFSTCESPWPDGVLGTVAKTRATEGMTGVGTSQGSANTAFWDINLNNLRVYTFRELVDATKNFRSDSVLGEGGFGRVYKGLIDDKSTSKGGARSVIAVKKMNPESLQGFAEWQTEIRMLGTLSHPNLIKLLGYCWEDEKLLLVYEYMPRGSFGNHLFGRGSSVQPLQWELRLKILIGAARALAFLHALKKQVIYRDFKASDILLDGYYNAKLSDFGFAKMGPSDGQSHVTTRVMGTYGYAAPEYVATGHLYVKSDVFGFGVVMAEVLTGLRALDLNRQQGKHNLVDWIMLHLSDKRKITSIMDSRLEGKYPIKAAVKMAQLTLRCLAPEPKARPPMKEVVDELEHIASAK
nr:leucine-rich repeat receptor protein kinase EMS1-like [Coffea arabica]